MNNNKKGKKLLKKEIVYPLVHGDIRHLEMSMYVLCRLLSVHGDIRHLEKIGYIEAMVLNVHGDIRHLEKCDTYLSS